MKLFMKKGIFIAVLFVFITISNFYFSQSITFNYTGAPQTWTVPACVSNITVTVAGAEGGGGNGGNGAIVTATLTVNPGDVLNLYVGGSGQCPGNGWNGGGIGHATSSGTTTWNSCGGGGASDIRIGGTGLANRIVVASGGGGEGGGSVSGTTNFGGNGGCATGFMGGSTFGTGALGGTQTAGGAGGIPWASTPPGGYPGVLGVGGEGGPWQTASGGGGGGGLYGGGGGGNDGCCTGANGGGGGGGGSSLTPAGGGCTAGGNNGPGYITINYTPSATATNTGPYCAGSTIQLNGGGGTTYAWTGPNGFTSSLQNPTIPNATINNAGVYSLSVDGGTCTATTTVQVVNPPTPNAGLDQTICLGSYINLLGVLSNTGNTGSWQAIVPSGLTPPATATFTPNSNSMNTSVMVNQPGIYYFVLREANSICGIVRDTLQVTVSDLQIDSAFTNPLCFGSSDGTITITSVGASEYSFDNGTTWVTSNTQGGFASGTYTICSRNVLGCQKCTTVTLTDPPAVTIALSNDTTICQNGTAVLSASATGGTTYSFHWNHTSSLLPSVSINPIATGYYPVQAENEFGCLSPFDSILVTVLPPISGLMSPDVYVCPGYPDSLMVTATGGNGGPYHFNWNTGLSETGTSSKLVQSPQNTTTYTVTITDNCESTPLVLSGVINTFILPVPLIDVDINPRCEPARFELYNKSQNTVSSNTIWRLSNNDEFNGIDTIMTSTMMNGLYDVQLIVTSLDGCIDSTTFEDYLIVKKKPVSDFNWSPNPATMFNTKIRFSEFTTNASSFEWYFPGGDPSSSNEPDQYVMYPDGQTGTYYVTLIAHSDLGCIDSITKEVVVMPEVILYAPNTFTPDGDEFNQTWRVYIEGVDKFKFNLKIFNRWGEIIFESNDPEASWDGTYHGKIVPYGTYTWIIESKELITDKKYTWNGSINIIK